MKTNRIVRVVQVIAFVAGIALMIWGGALLQATGLCLAAGAGGWYMSS